MSSSKKESSSKKQLSLVPPLTLVNRFQSLGTIPRQSYSSALASESASQLQMSTFKSSRTEYVQKPLVHNLFFKEPAHKNIQDPIDLVSHFFPPGWHFVPHHPEKSITFYKDILLKHKSVVFKPIYDRVNTNKIIYHSMYIHNFVSLDEWGHPSLLRTLPGHSLQYNYYDYMESWFKVILHQNESFTHSWFFCFDHKFKSVIPSWFLRWWNYHGAIPDILPIELMDQVNYFSSQFKVNAHNSQFPILLLFISKYKVPWIFKWQYSLSNNILARVHFVKWWDTFKHPRVIEQVKAEFPVKVPTPVKQSPIAPIQQVPMDPYQSSKLAPASSSQSKSTRPSSSKSKVKAKSSSPNSEDLLKMFNQFIKAQAQAKAEAQDEKSTEGSAEDEDQCSEASVGSSSKSPYEYQSPDAQDPFA